MEIFAENTRYMPKHFLRQITAYPQFPNDQTVKTVFLFRHDYACVLTMIRGPTPSYRFLSASVID